MDVNERIKARRKELDLDADTMADLLGISRATYYRYESKDIEKIPISALVPLAKALHVSPAYLMGWDEKEPAPTSSLSLTQQEETHIKKYRQLSDVRRYVVDEVLDAQYQKQLEEQSAEKEEESLG